jgi:hypothetical protein
MSKRMNALRLRLTDVIDLRRSRRVDIKDVESVCLALGPYRNLTTLTASVLFLHPDCQVLNHAGARIFGKKQIDFLADFSTGKLDRFIQFAITISGKGTSGDLGGSVTHSHAFESKHEMRDRYDGSGLALIKNNIKCLFWKESLRTSNLIRERHIDLSKIFDRDPRPRFLLPIRHPLDCAVSNLKSRHCELFPGLDKNSSVADTVQAILDEIFWFAELKENHPERFFYFFEHEISAGMLVNLAEFLGLEPEEEWIANALSVMKIKSGYSHDQESIQFYKDYITGKKTRFPDLCNGLLSFTE